MTDNQEPKFPFVVRHKERNQIGVAFRKKYRAEYDYYSVSAIQPLAPGESSWAVWRPWACEIVPDKTPKDLGYRPKSNFRKYLRNKLTGAVAIAYGQTWSDGKEIWTIEKPDGRRSSRWYKAYSEEISKAEYDAADKTLGHDIWNRGSQARHQVKRANAVNPGHNRQCRMCGKSCWPNWFYCPECHQLVSAGHDWSPENDGSRAGL